MVDVVELDDRGCATSRTFLSATSWDAILSAVATGAASGMAI
jgi:hypothetical protein